MSRILSLLLAIAALVARSWATYASFTRPGDKDKYQVGKVVDLLEDMQKQLAKEAAEDEKVYDKVNCWCKKGKKTKTKSIADAKAKIADLSTEIEELSASSAKLGNEIDKFKKELAGQQKALEQVNAIRDKEAKAFKKEEAGMLSSISALRAAVAILKKSQGGASFLEQPRGLAVRAMLQRTLEGHASLLDNVLEPSALRDVMAFVQAPGDNSYKPQSGEVLGVLEQMLWTFQDNLEKSQAQDKKTSATFDDLKAAKEAQVKASGKAVNDKTKSKANVDKKNADAKTDLVDTKKALAADEVFLKKLLEKCKATDAKYKERLEIRQAEMKAVSEAHAILNGDEARDMFSRTLETSFFLQKESAVHSSRRTQASEFLAMQAKRLRSSQLSRLAYSVRLDAFTQVKKSIDDLVSDLLKDQSDEKKQKEWCDDAFKKNKLKTEKKKGQKKELSARIDALETIIDKLNEAIDKLKDEITEMQGELKDAGEDREQENQSFQHDVAEQRETQKLLQAALRILGKFYEKKAAAFIQDGEQDSPKGFEGDYKNNKKSAGVLALLKEIIADVKKLEAEAIKGEKEAQKEYEDLVVDMKKSIKAKSESIVSKAEAKGKAEVELDEKREDKEAVEGDLEELADYDEELHEKCDFLLKNFKVRQTSRSDEIEALKQAKAILSGSKFKKFLQRA